MWRGKDQPPRSWLRLLKRERWMRLLSGRIYAPSHAARFVAVYAASLAVIPARERASRASSAGLTILAGSGHPSPEWSTNCAPSGVSSRTSRTMPIRDSASSDRTWKAWVTTLRREYSQRKKSARRIDGSGFSSSQWPTANVPNGGRSMRPEHVLAKGATPKGKRQVDLQSVARMWPMATAADAKASGAAGYQTETRHSGTTLTDAAVRTPLWATPDASVMNDGQTREAWERRHERELAKGYNGNDGGTPLAAMVTLWSTPRASPNENRNTQPAPSHGNGHGRTLAEDALTWARNADESDSAAPCSTPESISSSIPTIRNARTSGHRGTSAQLTPDCGPFWGTPRVTTNGGSSNGQTYGKGSRLEDQAAAWATPTTRDGKDGGSPSLVTPTNSLLGRQAPRWGMNAAKTNVRVQRLWLRAKAPKTAKWLDRNRMQELHKQSAATLAPRSARRSHQALRRAMRLLWRVRDVLPLHRPHRGWWAETSRRCRQHHPVAAQSRIPIGIPRALLQLQRRARAKRRGLPAFSSFLTFRQAPRMLTAGDASLLPDEWISSRLYLNPRFVCWLMGWPAEWTNSAPEGMESWLCRQRTLLRSLLAALDTSTDR